MRHSFDGSSLKSGCRPQEAGKGYEHGSADLDMSAYANKISIEPIIRLLRTPNSILRPT